MLKSLFKRSSDKRRPDHLPGDDDAVPSFVERGSQGQVHVNMDAFDTDEQKEFYDELARLSDIPVYEGHVEHAYGKRHVSDIHECPRCHAWTKQQYANFIYATQIAPRVMLAPAGHFCTDCPCVVIDEDMIKAGILDRQFRYQGVLGIDYRGKKEPDFFRTWNGQDAIYVIDEHQRPLGIATFDGAQKYKAAGVSSDACAQRKKRRRPAKRSRKRNRRR